MSTDNQRLHFKTSGVDLCNGIDIYGYGGRCFVALLINLISGYNTYRQVQRPHTLFRTIPTAIISCTAFTGWSFEQK